VPRKLTDQQVKELRAAGIAVPEAHEELHAMLQQAQRKGGAIPIDVAMKQIKAALERKWRKEGKMNRKFSDEEVQRLRKAGIAVPETIAEARKMLLAGERSGKPIPVDDVMKRLKARLSRKRRAKSA
jgi:hypothetical protein